MFKLELNGMNQPFRMLCLGAHCDDIEIGCGGSILQLALQHINSYVKWVVFTSTEERRREAQNAAEKFLIDVPRKDIVIRDFPDSYLPYVAGEVKAYFEELKATFDPDIVFTHFGKDAHQDHRLINELTWNTYRNHLILEYEIPKYDGDLGAPNFFIPIDPEKVEQKTNLILENYHSQSQKQWFDRETFLSLLRLRGMESASETRYAEAFYIKKAVLNNNTRI